MSWICIQFYAWHVPRRLPQSYCKHEVGRGRVKERGCGRGRGAAIDLRSAAALPADYLTYVASVCFVRRRVKRLRDFPRFARAKAKQSEIFRWGSEWREQSKRGIEQRGGAGAGGKLTTV